MKGDDSQRSLRHQWRRSEAQAKSLISPEDEFRAALVDVQRLPETPEAPRAPQKSPQPRQSRADEAEVIKELKFAALGDVDFDGSALSEYLAPGGSPKLLKKLKRGQFAVTDELDLHMLTLAQAQTVLKEFLRECRSERRLCVRVVHGKGQRSAVGPVLKAMVDRSLRQRSDVLAFASCKPGEGGTGAVVILLKP